MTMTFEHWSRVIDQLPVATGPGGRTVRGKRFPVPRVHKKSIFIIFVSAAQAQIQISPLGFKFKAEWGKCHDDN